MIKQAYCTKIFTGITTALVIFSAGFIPTLAQERSGFSILPSFLEIDAEPGDTAFVKIRISNFEASEFEVIPVFLNSKNNNGEKILSKDNSQAPASWISLNTDETEIIIEEDETLEIPFKIEIPEDAEIQGYYPVIALELAARSTENKTVGANARLASSIYLNVAGENQTKEIKINEFNVYNSFTINPKVDFDLKIQNTGNTHVRPRASLEIFDPNGVRQQDIVTFNDKYEYLLPNDLISEVHTWEDSTLENSFLPPIGEYKGVLKIYADGDQPEINQSTITFWVLPYQYIIYGLVLIGLGGVGGYFVKSRRPKS